MKMINFSFLSDVSSRWVKTSTARILKLSSIHNNCKFCKHCLVIQLLSGSDILNLCRNAELVQSKIDEQFHQPLVAIPQA